MTYLYILHVTFSFHLHFKSQDRDFQMAPKALKFTSPAPSCKNRKLKYSSVLQTLSVASKRPSEHPE